ncbi:MAG: hypothetical protein GF368_03505 [Candidatus Aenigmarchaeota archaeon]|nr:hypothetical protein [Candidatus Aenigmarchaeota archaeon]
MSKKDELRDLKKKIVYILKKNNVKKAGLFGSFVTGEATEKSDIDILIEFKRGKSLLDLIGLEMELEESLKRDVDLLTYNSIHPLLKDTILSEEVRII